MRRYALKLNEFEKRRRTLLLSERQKAALIGMVLGDGTLQLSKDRGKARLQVSHSEQSSEYLEWKRMIFEEWTPNGIRRDGRNRAYRFTSLFHPEFASWQRVFYLRRVKRVPPDINQILKYPLSLAIWFMDDGNGYGYRNTKALRISTYGFGADGNRLLQQCLIENFSVKTNIISDRKGYQLYIPVGEAAKFYQLVRVHICPTMKYKFVLF